MIEYQETLKPYSKLVYMMHIDVARPQYSKWYIKKLLININFLRNEKPESLVPKANICTYMYI